MYFSSGPKKSGFSALICNYATNLILDNGSSSKYFYVPLPEIGRRFGFLMTDCVQHPPSRQHSQWVCSTDIGCCCIAQQRQWHVDVGAQEPSHSSHSRWTNCLTSRQNHHVIFLHPLLDLWWMTTVWTLDTESQQNTDLLTLLSSSQSVNVNILQHCSLTHYWQTE